jgi:hypothetical protein
MGKHFTEQLVADFHRQTLPVAIVRPTLVCGLAGAPYPGFCGNLAGEGVHPCANCVYFTLLISSCRSDKHQSPRRTCSTCCTAAQYNCMAAFKLQVMLCCAYSTNAC